MARYELILKLDGALWLRIILNHSRPQNGHGSTKKQKESKMDASWGSGARPYPNPLDKQNNCPHINSRFLWPFLGSRGFKMIVSHRAPSSFNMSSYRAIWTHFRQQLIFSEQNNARSWSQNPGSGSIKLFLLGGCRPPDPPLFLGGFQPPRPPGGGPAAPRAPLHTERLRLSGSPQILVPRSWYQAPNLWVRCRRRFFFLRKGPHIFGSP